jgi:cation diffusion facilitator family transporter
LSQVSEKCVRCSRKVPFITLSGNLGMGAIKCIVGALSGSVGLTVDGFHSLTDAIGTLFVLMSLRVAGKSRDASHPYGHGKVEFMASLVVFTVLIGVGGLFFFESISILIEGRTRAPNMMAFLVAAVSVTANYIMYNFNLCAGRRMNSPALIANGYENLTDLCSSIPVGVGIVAAQFGYYFADPLAGVAVSIFIVFNATREWWHSFNRLMDQAAPTSTRRRIRALAVAVDGVVGTRQIRTRQVGQNLWVDLDILVSQKCTVERASRIADDVRACLLRKARHVEEVVVYFYANGRRVRTG